MNGKIKKSTLLFLTIIIVFILEYHFWYLVKIPNFYVRALLGRYSRLGLGILALVIWLALVNFRIPHNLKVFCRFVFFSFVLLTIYSFIRRPDQGIFYVLGATSQILCLLYVKPLYIFFSKYGGIDKFLHWLNYIVLFWYVVMIVQNILNEFSGTLILQEYFQNSSIVIGEGRYENVRVNILSCGVIIPLYNFYYIIKNSNKKNNHFEKVFHIISFVLGSYCIVFISQGRAETLAYFLGLFTMFLFRPLKRANTVIKPIVFSIILYFLFAGGYLSSLLDSFGRESELYVSTAQRMIEYAYFFKAFLANPLFGNGLFYNCYSEMYRTSFGIMWNNDVGIVGMLGSSGLFGTIPFVYIIIRLIKAITLLKRQDDKSWVFFAGILSYFVLGMIAKLFTDPTAIMLLPVVLSVVEYKINCYKEI